MFLYFSGMIKDVKAEKKYDLGKTLQPGDYINVYGTFAKQTDDFKVYIRDAKKQYVFRAKFHPLRSVILNTKQNGLDGEIVTIGDLYLKLLEIINIIYNIKHNYYNNSILSKLPI